MVKYIAFAVILLLVIFASYKGLQVETEAPIIQSKEVEPAAESTQPPIDVTPEVKKETKKVEIPDTKVKEGIISEEKLADDVVGSEEEASEEDAPAVRRDQLIGGADVEWEEPKPRDPNNKFGEPPL